jgi:hypothetical protein
LHCRFPGAFEIEDALLLPRSLEELFLSSITVGNDKWRLGILNALPPNLKRLEGIWEPFVSSQWIQNVPKTLETIEDIKFAPNDVQYLPESFTELALDDDNLDVISAFPPNLKTLDLYFLPDSIIEKLPNQLRSLSVAGITWSGEIVSKLPRDLTTISTYWATVSIGAVEPLFKALSATLTSLQAYPAGLPPADEKLIVGVPTPSQSSLLLPRSMKHLEIGTLGFLENTMAEWILGLPKRLVELKLSITDFQPGIFKSLGHLHYLKTFDVVVFHSPFGGWAQHLIFKELPRNIKSFRILDKGDGDANPDITNDCFIGAPLSLRLLTIPDYVSHLLSKECLLHLPFLDGFWVYQHIFPARFRTFEWFYEIR